MAGRLQIKIRHRNYGTNNIVQYNVLVQNKSVMEATKLLWKQQGIQTGLYRLHKMIYDTDSKSNEIKSQPALIKIDAFHYSFVALFSFYLEEQLFTGWIFKFFLFLTADGQRTIYAGTDLKCQRSALFASACRGIKVHNIHL